MRFYLNNFINLYTTALENLISLGHICIPKENCAHGHTYPKKSLGWLAKKGKIRYNRYNGKRRNSMSKFFVKEEQIQKETITIEGNDVNHIKNVLRLKEKEEIQVTGKQEGITYRCVIETLGEKQVVCKIIEKQEESHELSFSITVFQGLPKAEKMEWVIQKCTELGVAEFVPVVLQNCVVKLDEKTASKKVERWQKIAEVAAKQSGRDKIPLVQFPQTLQQIGTQMEQYDAVMVAYEKEETHTLKQALREVGDYKKIAICIGPEGGLEDKEVQFLHEKGAKVVTLGKRILRTETVALVMTSNLIYDKEG